jgi:hypothetical protein
LCCEGAKWLHKNLILDRNLDWIGTCNIVAVELVTAAAENPDVWGLAGGNSAVIEVKTSRSDFLHDKKKLCRKMENYSCGNHITYNLPDINVRTGLEYRYKFLSVFYDNQFWCVPFQHGAFTPQEVHFSLGVSANITKKIKVTVMHTCWHPINTSGEKHVSLYGGNETITLSYGY